MNAEFETNNVGESGNTDRTGNVFPETKRKTEWKVLSELKTTRPAVQKTSAKLANIPKSISYIRSVSSWITAWEKVTYAIDNVDHAGLHQSSGCVCVCMYVFFFVPPFSFFFFFIFLLHAITIYFFYMSYGGVERGLTKWPCITVAVSAAAHAWSMPLWEKSQNQEADDKRVKLPIIDDKSTFCSPPPSQPPQQHSFRLGEDVTAYIYIF